MYLNDATVDAGKDGAAANLGRTDATLYVDGTTIEPTLKYQPEGIDVDGRPSSGDVEAV